MNSVPIVIAFKFIGKKFTLYSCITILLVTFLTDIIPVYAITYDVLLISIFGGLINGFAITLCLKADATTGGTDFIAIAISERFGIDSFNYILFFNAIILTIDGYIFGWDKALYSIIFQFSSTQVIHILYKRYKKNTLLIVTQKPKEIADMIYERHQFLSAWLQKLGVDSEVATEDACRIEHVISPESFEAIKNHISLD